MVDGKIVFYPDMLTALKCSIRWRDFSVRMAAKSWLTVLAQDLMEQI